MDNAKKEFMSWMAVFMTAVMSIAAVFIMLDRSINSELTNRVYKLECSQGPDYGIADQVEKVLPAVVHISKDGVCQGSGCLISDDGLIFTAKHVTDGGGDFTVTLNNGDVYHTDLCVEDADYDAAFLKIDAKEKLPYNTLANLADVRVGDGIFIAGSPFGFDNFNSVTMGILSSRQRDLIDLSPGEALKYGWSITFQTDAAANRGNSGGPVFNMDGEVIGILVAGMTECVNYSVPVAVFMDDIDVVRMAFKLNRFKYKDKPMDVWDDHSYGK